MRRLAEFSHRTRLSNLERLAREEFDLLIVGGGITGAGIARDATLKGLRVALVERRDFAVGTSSRSSKLIHGGLRYLPQGDVALVMEAANERRAVRRVAPHLVRPQPMLVPTGSRRGYVTLSAGLFTYDRMARVQREERNRMLGQEETLALEPSLRRERIYGAALYYEYLTDDARLVMETLKAAAALGAVVVNRASVTGFEEEAGRIVGARIHDAESDSEFVLRAHCVVNAAGPWVDAVRGLEAPSEGRRLHLTKGIHLILPFDRLPVGRCVVMTAADKRSVFVIPRDGIVYLGTTDTTYEGRMDDPPITREDATYLLEAANQWFDIPPLGFEDVVGAWSGLRPLLHQEGKKPSEISRKDEVMVSPGGLISIAGGKLTTFRRMAERISGMVIERLQSEGRTVPAPLGASEAFPLSGGDMGEDVDGYRARLRQRWPEVAPAIVDRLVLLYGTNGERMVEAMAVDPVLAEPCAPGSLVTQAEVAHAVREEMALTLEDFLERRARLFLWDERNGLPEAPTVARIMGEMLGWNEARQEAELRLYAAHVADVKDFRETPLGDQPAQAVNG